MKMLRVVEEKRVCTNWKYTKPTPACKPNLVGGISRKEAYQGESNVSARA
jgi:hypothetical protein